MITKNKVQDELFLDGELLLFKNNKIFHLQGLAPYIWKALDSPQELSSLTTHIIKDLGTPPSGNAESLVEDAVQQLVKENLLTTTTSAS
ncbi:MAG: PqqD family peptide modification chaperone [Micrococcaceae bacterium]